MAEKLIDIYGKILKYNKNAVYIAFHNKTGEPYFHAKQVCLLLEYEKIKEAIRTNALPEDIFILKDIVKNYKVLYPNVQGHTKFINEAGLYSIILKSKKKYQKKYLNG
jgi:prophage antirepressor-like protein